MQAYYHEVARNNNKNQPLTPEIKNGLMPISDEKLEEIANWKTDVADPSVQQMLMMLVMNMTRDLARELIEAREKLRHWPK